jgi:hypothetical protein
MGDDGDNAVDASIKPLAVKEGTPLRDQAIIARFNAPWKWSELGIVIRDFEDGVRLDHVVSESAASRMQDLRVGLQLARVGRYDTEHMHFTEVTKYIMDREKEQNDLILKFVRMGTAGMDETTDFVINPASMAKGVNAEGEDGDKEEPFESESDGPSGNALYILPKFENFKLFSKMVQPVYEGLMILAALGSGDFGNAACVVALIGCVNVWWSGYPMLRVMFGGEERTMIIGYVLFTAAAIPMGMVGHWMFLYYVAECQAKPDEDTWGSLSADEVCAMPDWMGTVAWATIVFDVIFRGTGLVMAAITYGPVIDWLKDIEDEKERAAVKLQAIMRGNTQRTKIRREKGVVTRAIAGNTFKAHYYTPSTPIEEKAQQYLKLWRKSRVPQSFHMIRSQASQVHACMIAIRETFLKFDADSELRPFNALPCLHCPTLPCTALPCCPAALPCPHCPPLPCPTALPCRFAPPALPCCSWPLYCLTV